MTKTKKKKQKAKKLDSFIIVMTVAMFLLLVVWIVKDYKPKKKKEETTVTEQLGVEEFTKIDLTKALELIKEDKLTFIYIGYEGCDGCDKFVPKLAKTSQSFDVEVYYLNMKEIDLDSKEWKTFTKKLTKKVKLNTQKDGKTQTETKTIGKFLLEYGYTPTFLVLKKDKFVDGNIGGMSIDELTEFLSNVGFEKNS